MDSQTDIARGFFWYQHPVFLFFFGCAGLALMTVAITGLLSRVQRSVDQLRRSQARLRKTNEDLRLEISEQKQAQEALRISEQRRLAQLARAKSPSRFYRHAGPGPTAG
jgi:Flp pilus assembly protein TadB